MAKKAIALLCVVLLLLQCICFASCKKETNKYSEYLYEYFDTVTTVIGYEDNKEDFDNRCAEIKESLAEYHRLFDIYQEYEGINNLYTVNEVTNGAHRVVSVDERIIDMLLFAVDMHKLTSGKVNIAMGSVLSIWHKYRENGDSLLPPYSELKEASEHTDINNLIIDKENSTVTITDAKMTLDVGAVAKGYAVEMIAKKLEENGVSGYVINVGGNVRTIGVKGNGEKWSVGIENPTEDENNPYISYLSLSGESLVTSGAYQRYYIVDGKKYHHIIDDVTLMPSERFLSVSVVCKSSAEADALSTALFCMDFESGKAFIESIPETEALWVFSNGEQKKSNGFSDYEQ